MAMCKIPSRKTVIMKTKRWMDIRVDASLEPAELHGLFPHPSHATGYSHLHKCYGKCCLGLDAHTFSWLTYFTVTQLQLQ